MFMSFLYKFLATMCPSSGEIIISMRHLVLVILKQVDDCLVSRLYPAYQTVIHTE